MEALKTNKTLEEIHVGNLMVRLSDHCVHRPKPTKSAGKTSKAPAAASSAAAASDGAGAAASSNDESIPIHPQKKARRDEGGGSK